MASVRRLPSGKWQGIAIHPSGKRATKAFTLKGQARAWADDTESGWRRGTVRDPGAGRMTVRAWYAIWAPTREISPTTEQRQTRLHRKLLLPHWGDWPLESIARTDVKAWVATMKRDGVSPAEIQMAFYGLSAMLRAASDETPPLIVHDPCARVKLPTLPPPPDRVFTPQEMTVVLDAMNDPWRTMAELSLWTGLRYEEIAGLHGDAVDWMRNTVHVRVVRASTVETDRAGAKSAAGVRKVPVPPHVTEAMSALMLGRARTDRVFLHEGRAPKYNTWFWHWRRAFETTGVEYARPYTLRHTAASWLTEAGVDQRRIADLLGHASLRPTWRYAHLAPGAHDKIRDVWTEISAHVERTGTPPGEAITR